MVIQGKTFYKGGDGFLNLNNTVTFDDGSNFIVGAGTVRVTTASLPANVGNLTLGFRGGVIEYDVSGGSVTFIPDDVGIHQFGSGVGNGNVNWVNQGLPADTLNPAGGSGGFSAYSTVAGNSLTINIGSDGRLLHLGRIAEFPRSLFPAGRLGPQVRLHAVERDCRLDEPARPSIAALRTLTRVCEINVTKGVGNIADKYEINAVISGSVTTDLVKTGTGVLELLANNTYAGNTYVARRAASGKQRHLVHGNGQGLRRHRGGSRWDWNYHRRYPDLRRRHYLAGKSWNCFRSWNPYQRLEYHSPRIECLSLGYQQQFANQFRHEQRWQQYDQGRFAHGFEFCGLPSFVPHQPNGSVNLDPSQTYSFRVVSSTSVASLSDYSIDFSSAPNFSQYAVAGGQVTLDAAGDGLYLNLTPTP